MNLTLSIIGCLSSDFFVTNPYKEGINNCYIHPILEDEVIMAYDRMYLQEGTSYPIIRKC